MLNDTQHKRCPCQYPSACYLLGYKGGRRSELSHFPSSHRNLASVTCDYLDGPLSAYLVVLADSRIEGATFATG